MNEKFGIKNSNKHHNEREKRVPTFSSRFDLSIKIRDDSTWLEQHSRRSIPCPSLSSVTHSRQEDFWIERALVTHPDWPSKRRIYRPRRRRLRFISLHTSDWPYSRSITLSKKRVVYESLHSWWRRRKDDSGSRKRKKYMLFPNSSLTHMDILYFVSSQCETS